MNSRLVRRVHFLSLLMLCAAGMFGPSFAQAQAAIQGTVTDRDSGTPLVNASIYSCPAFCRPLTTTDGNGNYSLMAAQINNGTTGTLYFQSAGYFIGQQAYSITSSPTTVNATLLAGGTIFQGTVTDANTQAGIVGAAVQLDLNCNTACTINNSYVTAYTGSDGQYSVDSSLIYEAALPSLGQSGGGLIYDYIAATAYFTYSNPVSPSIPIQAPYPITQNFALVGASGVVLQGMVTDRDSGTPLVNASIYSCPAFCRPLTTTDGNGNYSLMAAQINNGTTGTLYFQSAGYFIGQQAYSITSSPTTVNATLLAGGTIFQGTVTDANTQAGIVGAEVQLDLNCNDFCTTTESYVTAYTGSGGQYSVDSSLIYEAALPSLGQSGGGLVYENVSAAAYFTYSNPVSPSIPIQAPYPIAANVSLSWTSLTQNIVIATNPTGLNIAVDNVAAVAPQTYAWIPGSEHAISTTSPQPAPGGGSAVFVNWNDGGPLMHVIAVPNSAESITATFDAAAPVIIPMIFGPLGTNGWYIGNVSLSWSVTDPAAPVTSTSGCGPATVTSDTTGQTFTCTATGLGGTASQSATIKRDATPPVATATPSPLPNANGWNNSTVTVNFNGTDATSGIAYCSAPSILASQGAGQTSGSGTCTDKAGNVSVAVSATNINIDETPPVVTGSRSPSPNGAGWNDTPVTVTFTGIDALSGVVPNGCSAPVNLSGNGAGQSAMGQCTDLAGNVGSTTVSGINIDTSLPTAMATATPAPNANGWNNTDVTVSFTGTDSMSGSGIASCSANIILSAEKANQSASGTCTSVAGDVSAPATISGINIDKRRPTADITTPSNGAIYQVGAVVDASFTCADALSGVASCVGSAANGSPINTTRAGSKSFYVTATDLAGNVDRVFSSYSVTAASFSLAPDALAFGDQALHIASPVQTVTVTNTGAAALPITSITITGVDKSQYSETNNCGSSVGVEATCTISVVFKPTSRGSKTATLNVDGGDGAGAQNVSLSGTGT